MKSCCPNPSGYSSGANRAVVGFLPAASSEHYSGAPSAQLMDRKREKTGNVLSVPRFPG
jgi:hypothetical protein